MRRLALLLPLLALGAGATALAQGHGGPGEPDVRSRDVFWLPSPCRTDDRVTVRVRPSGTVLESVRVHVAGLEVVRLTNVRARASATVRVPDAPTRVTATADTVGGQALYRTRIYGRCRSGLSRSPDERPVIGGGED